MDPVQVIKAIQAAAQLSQSLVGLASQFQGVMSSQNEVEIEAALKDLRAANDALHQRVQSKLRSA